MEKSRKSKKLLVALAIALMAALVVGMGAMTYSRYITSGSTGNTTATAAKWGYVVTVSADNLFGSAYNQGKRVEVSATQTDVKLLANSGNVVAPGTSGSMTITINGSAEVNAQLVISVTEGTDIHLGEYYPIRWTLNEKNESTSTPLVEKSKLSEVVSKLQEQNATYEANTTIDKTYTLSWEWAIDGDDTKDTIIGMIASGKAKTSDEVKQLNGGAELTDECVTSISFNLTVSVKQKQNN